MPVFPSARVTLNDIARHAGVSRATVSLVLRGRPVVAEGTRHRVQGSMQELGYVYHRAAASLRTQRSMAVGLIVSDILNPFFAEVSAAIEARLDREGFVTLLGHTAERADKEARLVRTMREFPADGLLICPSLASLGTGTALATAGRIPQVAFARRLPGLDFAGVENAAGAELAVEHLHAVGHRRIAYLGGDPGRSTGRERLEGFSRAARRLGLPTVPELILPGEPNRRGGHDGLRRALSRKSAPTAAVCFNDLVAFGALEALGQLGRRAGADFGVVGFNNVADAALSRPGLTTVDTAPAKLGETAADLLLHRLAHPDSPVRDVILRPTLVVRESCGARRLSPRKT